MWTLFAVESFISCLLNNVTCFVEASPDSVPESSQSKRKSSATNGKATTFTSDDSHLKEKRLRTETKRYSEHRNGHSSVSPISRNQSSSEQSSYADDESDQDCNVSSKNQAKGDSQKISSAGKSFGKESTQGSNPKVVHIAISLFLCCLSVSASINLCFATWLRVDLVIYNFHVIVLHLSRRMNEECQKIKTSKVKARCFLTSKPAELRSYFWGGG